MHNDLQDSIKARLYDMKYTPFLASYVIAWIFFNAKTFLIFFSDIKVSDKIEMLAYANLLYLYPLYVALFYTLIFPIFGAFFYYVTLQYKRLMNKIKQKIQDVTPLPQEEANELLRENAELRLEHDEKIKALNLAKSNFEAKEKSLQDQHDELKILYKEAQENLVEVNSSLEKKDAEIKTLNQKMSLEQENLTNEINQKRREYKKALEELKTRKNEQDKLVEQTQKIKILEEQINEYKKKYPDLIPVQKLERLSPGSRKYSRKVPAKILEIPDPIEKAISTLTDDEKTLLKIIYDNDITMQSSAQYIDLISKHNNEDFKKVKVRKLLDNLVNKELINLTNGYYDTTAKGREVILKLFD